MTIAPIADLTPMNELVHRGAFDLDWRKVLRWGALLALGQWFIALAGMPINLRARTIVDPSLHLGFLVMLFLPIWIGYSVGAEKVLEGMSATARSARDVVAGFFVGLLGGLSVSLLLVLLDNFDLSEPLVNWNTPLLDRLTFDGSLGSAMVVWPIICALAGAFAGSLHLMGPRLRRTLGVIVGSVLIFSIFEAVISDLLKGFGLRQLDDALYAKTGGLTILTAIIVAVIAGLVSWFRPVKNLELRNQLEALPDDKRRTANYAIYAVAAAAFLILPQFMGGITNELLANVGIFLLLALGLNIVVGLAGILDLGYVAFFAVGGYTTAVLTSPGSPGFSPELPWWLALIVVVIMAALVGLFIGAPVIRMRGDYLAIVTLGFGEIIRLLFLSDWLSGWFGGAQGITQIPPADFGFFEVTGINPRSVYYLVLVFCALAIYVSWRLEKSRLGRAWMAIREDESVAEAMGINTVNMKLMAFVVGAVLASFSGAIFATKVGSIFPSSFLILVSIIILVVVIVGGMGSIPGVIAGSVVLIGVLGGPKQPGLLQEFSQYKLLIYGAILIWMMLKRPEGLIPNARRSRELHQDEFLQDAWLKGEIDDDDGAPDGVFGQAEGSPA